MGVAVGEKDIRKNGDDQAAFECAGVARTGLHERAYAPPARRSSPSPAPQATTSPTAA
jgi:hypothetical protein